MYGDSFDFNIAVNEQKQCRLKYTQHVGLVNIPALVSYKYQTCHTVFFVFQPETNVAVWSAGQTTSQLLAKCRT
jgi:hypothetical protein